MKIIGHPWVESEQFVVISALEKIVKTPTGSIVLVESLSDSIEIVQYCQNEAIPTAVRVTTLTEALFAHLLDAKYLIVPESIAQEIQSVAQNYLFDTQLLVQIDNESQIEQCAKMGIDGVIFSSAITKAVPRSSHAK